MFDRNFIVKNAKKCSENNAKKSPEKILPLPRIRQKNKIILFSYDVNDRVYVKIHLTSYRFSQYRS